MRIAKYAPSALVPLLMMAALAGSANQATEADTPEVEVMTTDVAPEEPLATGSDIIAMSLSDAVNLAIENNLGVEVERHAPLIAREDVLLAWSAYDPTLSGEITYANSRQPNTNPLTETSANRTKLRDGGIGLSGLLPYVGASLSMDYTASRTKSNSGIASLSPEWESGLALAANIPLLRGLVWNDPWTQVRVSAVARSASLESFRKVVMDTVQNTVATYWQLVAELERLRVTKKSLQTGEALLEQTITQYEVGVKSKVEVIQAEAGVAARELDVIRADATFRNSQDDLVDAVYGVRLTPEAVIGIQPTDSPSEYQEYEVNATVAAELAMKNRPELAVLEYDIERGETLVRFRKNQRLPMLDLNLAYGTSGIEGRGNPNARDFGAGLPEDTGGTFDDTHDDWFEKRGGREYSVGGMFSIPLGNSGPRHNVSKARLELRRSKTRLTQLHQQIILEVRRDIRLLEAARKGISASERQRIAAEEQLRAERIRLEHGESTPFDVLQKESDLVEAEVAKIEALQLYRTSASALDRAQGTILRTHNIVVGSVGALRNGMEPESFGVRDLLEPILP